MIQDADKFYRELGDKIREERLRNFKSQEELASHLDLTRTSIINLEKGRHRPSIYQLLQIADYFKLDYAKLMPISIKTSQEDDIKEPSIKNMVIDQDTVGKETKQAVLDFLSSIKKT